MKRIFTIIGLIILTGCGPPPPVSKETHIKQVQQAIDRAGGESNILVESRILFARLSSETNRDVLPTPMKDDPRFEGLSGITNLGDVFTFETYQSDRIRIRIHNSHFDTYHIVLLNPDVPEPEGFERIAGNVGFIKP